MPSLKYCAHLKMKINDLICALGVLFNPISACHPKLINLYDNWHEKTGTPLTKDKKNWPLQICYFEDFLTPKNQ